MADFSDVASVTFLDAPPEQVDDNTSATDTGTDSQTTEGSQGNEEKKGESQESTTPTPPADAQTGTQTPPPASTETEDKKASVVVDWNSITNGLVKDETELGTILNEYKTLKEAPKVEINENENLILDMYRKGQDVFKVMSLLQTDIEKLSAKEALKQKFISDLSDSDLTDEDKTLLFDDDFLNKYGDDDGRDRVSELKLKQDAKQAQKFLQTEKEKFLNIAKSTPNQSVVEQEKQKAELEKQTKEYQNIVSQFTNDFKSLEFNVEGAKINVDIDSKIVQKSMLEVWDNSIMGRFVNEKGNIDFQKLGTTLAYIDNMESIVKSAYLSGITAGKETLLKEFKNPSEHKSTQEPTTNAKTVAQQMFEQWK